MLISVVQDGLLAQGDFVPAAFVERPLIFSARLYVQSLFLREKRDFYKQFGIIVIITV